MFIKKGFLNGIVAGSIVGTLMGALFSSRRKPEVKKQVEGQAVFLRSRARKMAGKVSEGLDDLLERQR